MQLATLRVLAALEIPALDPALPTPAKIEFSTDTPTEFKRLTATGVVPELGANGDEKKQSLMDSDDNANRGVAYATLIAPARENENKVFTLCLVSQ